MLDFSNNGYENLFRQALSNGINLFCGAGFSVEAKDKEGKPLPTGNELLEELKYEFPSIHAYSNLSKACTKLIQTDKGSFYSFLRQRFSVESYSTLYKTLLDLPICNVYTTNIDDLFFQIYESSNSASYLIDRSWRGDDYICNNMCQANKQVNYFPLHGCIRSTNDYIFGATEIASAFSRKNTGDSWRSLAKDAEQNAILFWGWNFNDSGPIEAMYSGNHHVNENVKKWALLRQADPETIDFLKSLNFNIIIGDTASMLQYLHDFVRANAQDGWKQIPDEELQQKLTRYSPPTRETEASYPLKSFFCDYTPRWCYIFSKTIPAISYYKRIADWVAAGRNVIMTGIRGAGKTTLLMQLIENIDSPYPKHYMTAPTLEEVNSYISTLGSSRSILFIDDCFRDTEAIVKLMKTRNIQAICCDRDFNYERQYHKICSLDFETIDITELLQEDAQAILNVIPIDLKRGNITTKRFKDDPTLPNLLITALKPKNYKFIKAFYENDSEAARVFLMICYVHSCGVPCSFDMVYSFLDDRKYSWGQMLAIVQRAGKLIKEYEETTELFGSYDIDFSLQNYYLCRSRYFAEKIMESIPKGDRVFASVLSDFVDYVPPYKICAYDKFKRSGYDADLACRAFTDFSEGKRFYETCITKDESEYIYQQAAIYFSRLGNYKEAFLWIDRARNLAHYNRFSIDSTYAMIYFHANLGIDYIQCKEALNILDNCCISDKRKSIHYLTFAKCVLEYSAKHRIDDSDSIQDYIDTALEYIRQGLDDKNTSLRTKNKWELKNIKKDLEAARANYTA